MDLLAIISEAVVETIFFDLFSSDILFAFLADDCSAYWDVGFLGELHFVTMATFL